MSAFTLKPAHAPVKAYYETLERFGRGKFDNEGNVRRAFEALLEKCARAFEWMVVPEFPIPRAGRNPAKVDAAVLDAFNIPRGYWEAKDEKDDLKAEMNKKFADGYPRTNILFQKPTHAILFQDGRIAFNDEIETPDKLVEVLRLFFEWRQPIHDEWDRAVREFSDRIPDIAKGAMALIEAERKSNRAFIERFTAFATLCRESINPELKDEAVEEMLVQHLLTERIFRRIFDNPEFTRRNVIAAEIEKVIDSLTKRHFSRDSFLRDLDPFYKAIEETAANASDYSEKQAFLNKVYERFFQGFNKKQADTHGIVYTPQPIVDFMVRSVEEVLKAEFGRSLSDKGVHILDPFVGTGNFITRVMKEIRTSKLPHKYKEELHCNEIMLLPYYIASMNIEHAYLDRMGEDKYESFEGICLVDTFELAEPKQAGFEFMAEGNTERIRRQKKAPIFVVIGNPPYNMGQKKENDQNKNRKYKHMDARVKETYSKLSKATLRNKLGDPYVKAFRWASDRIRAGGVVALVTNSAFIDRRAYDGMRRCLRNDFDKIYVIDLGGDVNANPKLSGTVHNVFGIKLGVAITLLVKKTDHDTSSKGQVFFVSMGTAWTKEEKYAQLGAWTTIPNVQWRKINPNKKETWLTEESDSSFNDKIPLSPSAGTNAIFANHSLGISTNRDHTAFNFSKSALETAAGQFVDGFNHESARVKKTLPKDPKKVRAFVDAFVDYDLLAWSESLKRKVVRHDEAKFDANRITKCAYRPFSTRYLYLDALMVDRPGHAPSYFARENQAIAITSHSQVPFIAQAVSRVAGLDVGGRPSVLFPFYIYAKDGTNRQENITDWALGEFRKHYGEPGITTWDIFHYTYGLLHHPEYRTRYAANLKRELPRIPMAPEFRRIAEIGAALMKLHIEYEKQAEYPLVRTETGKLDWRVEKMSLSKDKSQLKYNEFLTLSGIPPAVYEYRLGNRSALEWVVDQYRVSTDARSGIVNDPNRPDDPEYIMRLLGQVVTVSVETVRLVRELAGLSIDQA
jgi:predicted helicase